MISAPRVLVESPTVQNQRIGVARAYEGAQSANALAQGADQIADIAFRYAAENAEQQGLDMAQAAARTDVMAIDPNTGEPVALNQMQGMGRIGSEAYRRVINSRFQQNIEEEIRNQATIFSAEYRGNPDAAALYTEAMSDYVSSMSQNATGMWRTVIEDTGTSYINRTRAALIADGIRRSNAGMRSSGQRANTEALSALQAVVANFGPAAFGQAGPEPLGFTGPAFPLGVTRSDNAPELGFSGMETSALAMEAVQQEPLGYADIGVGGALTLSARAGVSDNVEAGLFAPEALASMDVAARGAVMNGMLQYYTRGLDMSNPATVTQLSRLRFAIGSGDIPQMMRLAPELAPYADYMLSDAAAAADFDTFANRALSDAINLAELESELVQAELDARSTELALTWSQNAQDAAYQTRVTIRDVVANAPATLSTAIDQLVTEVESVRRSIPGERSEAVRTAMQERIDSTIESASRGLFDGLVADAPTQSEVDRIRQAFAVRNPADLTPAERVVYESVERLERFNPDIFDQFDTDFSGYREAARASQARAEEEAQAFLQDEILPYVPSLQALGTQDITSSIEVMVSNVQGLELDEGLANRTLNQIYTNAVNGYFNNAFGLARNGDELFAMRQYAEGVRGPDGLPQQAVEAINAAREVYGNTGNSAASYRSEVAAASERRNRTLVAQEREQERRQTAVRVSRGNGDSSRAEDRQAAQDILEREYQAAYDRATAADPDEVGLPPTLPVDLWESPEYLSNRNLAPLFQRAYNTHGFMPQSLMDAFEGLAAGNIGPSAQTLLGHWRQIRSIETNGAVLRNTALNAMSEEEIGRLNFLSEAAPLFGSERLAEAYAASAQLEYSPEANARVEAYLGQPMPDFLATVDGYNALSADQQAAMAALTRHYAAMSVVNPNVPTTTRAIRRRLEAQINEALPDSGGAVISFDSTGSMTNRTEFALERTIPQYQSEFLSYVQSDLFERTGISSTISTGGAMSMEQLRDQLRSNYDAINLPPQHFLVPRGRDGLGGVTYYVYEMDMNTSFIRPVMRTDEGYEGIPYMVSTAESGFRTITDAAASRERADSIRFGEQLQEIIGSGMFSMGLRSMPEAN